MNRLRVMRWIGGLIAISLVMPASACSDAECHLPLQLEFRKSDICSASGSVLLNPGNDSRINLALLLEQRGLAKLNLQPSADNAGPFPLQRLAMAAEPVAQPDQELWRNRLKALGIADDLINSSWDLLGAWQDGVCVSNNRQSAWSFIEAVIATDKLPAQDKKWLAEERLALADICVAELGQEDSQGPQYQSELALAFSSYLAAAAAFYSGALDDAATGFADLEQNQVDWLAETSSYLLARVYLNQAQVGATDEYGFFDPAKIRSDWALKTVQQLDSYLKRYPQGRYRESAQGLYRKAYWFLGNDQALAQKLSESLGQLPAKPERLLALLNETDNKYLFSTGIAKSPMTGATIPWSSAELASVVVLTRMRSHEPDSEARLQPVSLSELNEHKQDFAKQNQLPLFDYLQLAHQFFVEQNPEQVLALTENETLPKQLSNLSLSRWSLRALSLEQRKDWQAARQLWQSLLAIAQHPMHKLQLKLALALNFEASGQVAAAFAADSPITEFELRRPLLKFVADPVLLKQRLQDAKASQDEQATALFSLLYKSLLTGHYAEFSQLINQYRLADFKDVDGLQQFGWAGQSAPDYSCPPLVQSVSQLVSEPAAAQANNCVAEFLFRHESSLQPGDKPVTAKILGGGKDQFPGKPRSRLDWYLAVMANPQAADEDQAYALYRAINCFASSGNNQCGSQPISSEQRKVWFKTLKSTFKATVWAQNQKYYW